MTVTVLSKTPCVQCTATYRSLDSKGVKYDVQDIYAEENLALAQELKYMAAPVVIVRRDGEIVDHWAGFNPDRISDLASRLKSA